MRHVRSSVRLQCPMVSRVGRRHSSRSDARRWDRGWWAVVCGTRQPRGFSNDWKSSGTFINVNGPAQHNKTIYLHHTFSHRTENATFLTVEQSLPSRTTKSLSPIKPLRFFRQMHESNGNKRKPSPILINYAFLYIYTPYSFQKLTDYCINIAYRSLRNKKHWCYYK